MRTIHKYRVPITDTFSIAMPAGAELLSVQMQGPQPCLWALLDNDEPMTQQRHFVVIGTGNPVPKAALKYIGTFQQPPFVWHLFEVKP